MESVPQSVGCKMKQSYVPPGTYMRVNPIPRAIYPLRINSKSRKTVSGWTIDLQAVVAVIYIRLTPVTMVE